VGGARPARGIDGAVTLPRMPPTFARTFRAGKNMLRGFTVALGALTALVLGAAPLDARMLRWARSMDVSTLDPHAANTGPDILLAHQVYEPLIIRQVDGWMVPALATSWALSGDPKVWEFKLRPDVTFHDGARFTADDVVFSIERARSETSDMKSLLSSVESVTKVDDLTVRFRTKGPDPLLPNNLTDIFIMDREWSEKNGATWPNNGKTKDGSFAAANANGTGAYMLVSRQPGAKTVLRRNEAYWGRNEFPLEISDIVYRPIPDNAARIAALQAGEVDFVQDVPVQDAQRLQGMPGIRINTGPENRSVFLGMDIGSRELRSSTVKGRNPFADRRVREAVNMTIDRDAIRRSVMLGQSVPAGIIVPPFSHGYSRDLDRVPHVDRQRARALLQEAGYRDGFSVALHCTNDRYVNDEGLCRRIAEMLGEVGIRVRVTAQPAVQHFPQVRRAELDFYLLGWGVTTFDSEYIFSLLYHTNTGALGGWIGTKFSDPVIDAEIRALRTEIDVGRRNAAMAGLWQKLKAETIYIPLHNQTITHAMRDEFNIPIDVSNQPKMKYVGARRH
jgi:peptide/nickel transport system substrate-binding protein